jgi:hypothetical protein
VRRSHGRGFVLKGAVIALSGATAAVAMTAIVTVTAGRTASAWTAPRPRLELAIPVQPLTVALTSDDNMPTGSIGRHASAPLAASIFAPRLEFVVAPTGAPDRLALVTPPASVPDLRDEVPLPLARPKLAYARPDFDMTPPPVATAPRTAVYDIEARTVFMPNGLKLEAHSGYGEFMDDPASLKRKMRGVTPPNAYNLKFREALFHGVKAIRLTPVDEDKMFGRNGILAHSYLLGPNGQSHGCVSFRNYAAFLRAFERGEVERMVVVGRGGTQLAAGFHGRPASQYVADNAPVPPVVYANRAPARVAGMQPPPRMDTW